MVCYEIKILIFCSMLDELGFYAFSSCVWCDFSCSCSWPSGSAVQGVGGIHQATASGWVEGYRRRDVARQNGEEADELVVQVHDAHALLLTEVALLP